MSRRHHRIILIFYRNYYNFCDSLIIFSGHIICDIYYSVGYKCEFSEFLQNNCQSPPEKVP